MRENRTFSGDRPGRGLLATRELTQALMRAGVPVMDAGGRLRTQLETSTTSAVTPPTSTSPVETTHARAVESGGAQTLYHGGMILTMEGATPEAEAYPHRSVLIRAVGLEHTVAVEVFEHALPAGDRVLICSDGGPP
jgi:hypothetical protein